MLIKIIYLCQKKRLLLSFVAVFSCFITCKESDDIEVPQTIVPETGKILLGKKLNNPYSVENMRKAYFALLTQTRSGIENTDIEDFIHTTHLYVVFKPKTEEELGVLKSDSTLILYPYPLDYEIIAYGENPETPNNQSMHYYASVPADKELTKEIEWEILENLSVLTD